MNDNEIKKIIKESFDNCEIKTSSNKILAVYNDRLEERTSAKKHKAKLGWGIGSGVMALGALAASIVLTVTLLPNGNNINPDKIVRNPLQSRQSQTAISILGALSAVDSLGSVDTSIITPILSNAVGVNEEDEENKTFDFASYVNHFDPNVDIFYKLLDGAKSFEDDVNVSLLETPYVGLDGVEYSQYMTFTMDSKYEKYIFYTNLPLIESEIDDDEEEIEQHFSGELFVKDIATSYKCELILESEIDKEDKEEEREIQMNIYYKNNQTISINQTVEQEAEEVERSYVYTIKDNNLDKELLVQEISFEEEKKELSSCELEVTVNENERFNYQNIKKRDDQKLGLLGQMVLDDGLISFEMLDEHNTRIYTSDLVQDPIIKKN